MSYITIHISYAAVNGHLELTLLKDRQRFDAVSTSNLEVYKFRDWWILTYFIFGPDESSPNNIWSKVNLERMCGLLFYFLYFKVNLDLEKTNQLGESSPNSIFAVVNLDPIILEKRWIDGESWPNDFVEKVNRGEDLRWVGSRCPSMRALINKCQIKEKKIKLTYQLCIQNYFQFKLPNHGNGTCDGIDTISMQWKQQNTGNHI